MKRILLTITALLALAPLAAAQQESAVAVENTFLTATLSTNIIRNWQDAESIVFAHTVGGTRIAKTSFAMQCATGGAPPTHPINVTDKIIIPGNTYSQINIFDMKFVGNTAYFCGSVLDKTTSPNPTERGIFGSFIINELDATSVSVKFFILNPMRRVTRMVAYPGPAGDKLVGVGICYDMTTTPTSHKSALVEFDIQSSPLTMNMVQDDDDFLHDIVLAGDQVVVVGYSLTNNGQMVLRKTHKYSVTSTTSTYDKYRYTSTEVNHVMRATYLGNNEVAVAYTHHEPSTGQFSQRLRVVDISTMDMRYSQEYPTISKEYPIEMAYDSVADILTVMYPMPFNDNSHSYNRTYFVQMKPHTLGSYTAQVLIPESTTYSSLDMFKKQYYVAIGSNNLYYQHTVAPQPNANRCPKVEKIKIAEIDNQDSFQWTFPGSSSYTPNATSATVSVFPSEVTLICTDQ